MMTVRQTGLRIWKRMRDRKRQKVTDGTYKKRGAPRESMRTIKFEVGNQKRNPVINQKARRDRRRSIRPATITLPKARPRRTQAITSRAVASGTNGREK